MKAHLTFGCKHRGRVRDTQESAQGRKGTSWPFFFSHCLLISSWVCQGVLSYKPWRSTAPCGSPHGPASRRWNMRCRRALLAPLDTTLPVALRPLSSTLSCVGSAILATAQNSPKQLPQETKGLLTSSALPTDKKPSLAREPQGAKARGAKTPAQMRTTAPKPPSLPRQTVSPFPVKFPKTNSTVRKRFGAHEPTPHTNSLLGLPEAPR